MYKFLKQARDNIIKNSNVACYRSKKITQFFEMCNKQIYRRHKLSTNKIDQFMYIIYKYCNHLPNNDAVRMDLDLLHCGLFTWDIERLIWIAFYNDKNMFAQLPKDLVSYIISFAKNNKKDIEKIIFPKIEKSMRYIILKYIWNESCHVINISSAYRNRLLNTYNKIRQTATVCCACSYKDKENDTDTHIYHDDNKDNGSKLDNIGSSMWGIDINSALEKIDALNDDYSNDDLVDFVTCFDEAILEMTYFMRGPMARFVRTKKYARFVKHLKKKQDSSKQKIEKLTSHSQNEWDDNDRDMHNFGLDINTNHNRWDDSDDNEIYNFNDALNVDDEQKKFYLDFIEPTRR